MGNCLGRSRRGRHGGGGGEHCTKKRAVWPKEKVVAVAAAEEEETCEGVSETPAPATGHVKISITRRHLEELLRRADAVEQDGGVPVREVISELLCDASSSNVRRTGAQGQWRPSLQSIPE